MKKHTHIIIVLLAATMLLSGCTIKGHFWKHWGDDSAQSLDESSVKERIPEKTMEKEVTLPPTETPVPTVTPTPTPIPTEPIPEGMIKSELTGEYIPESYKNKRPMAFMIDNVSDALPQSGISKAKMYFEAPVETNLTRMMAVFEDYSDLPRIGPLRSCRDYFLSMAAGLDELYVHYGQAAYALPYLESDDVDNISGLAWYTDQVFYRDNSFHSAPHNAYASTDGLLRGIDTCGYRTEHYEGYKQQYKFHWVGIESRFPSGQEASFVGLGYPYNHPKFYYQPDTGLYLREQYGGPHIDVENGEQIAVKNIIIEFQNYANYQESLYLHFDTTAGGRGKYVTNGKAVDITWERPSFYEPVVYRTLDGKELKLNPGKTFVCLVQNENIRDCVFGASEETATCCVPEAEAAAAVEYNAEWRAAYKYEEDPYLSIMAHEKEAAIASHGGKSKVQVGSGDGDF
ncbi:MAG: DUF3048 domain-containing protein [Lachnospiraceae bacterium]|nr:DUF3048 domain-containing protein [Lachnospiraceae bacterium]